MDNCILQREISRSVSLNNGATYSFPNSFIERLADKIETETEGKSAQYP